jgi:hypothetical protein
MKSNVALIVAVVSTLAQVNRVTVPLTLDFDHIRLRVEPLVCERIEASVCSVCDVSVPAALHELFARELNRPPVFAAPSYCCGEQPNSFIEFSSTSGDSLSRLKLYFWACNFASAQLTVNGKVCEIPLSDSLRSVLKDLYRRYSKQYYTPRGLDSLRAEQNTAMQILTAYSAHLSRFDPTMLAAMEHPGNTASVTVPKMLQDKVAKLRKDALAARITVRWDESAERYLLTPDEIKNPDDVVALIPALPADTSDTQREDGQ